MRIPKDGAAGSVTRELKQSLQQVEKAATAGLDLVKKIRPEARPSEDVGEFAPTNERGRRATAERVRKLHDSVRDVLFGIKDARDVAEAYRDVDGLKRAMAHVDKVLERIDPRGAYSTTGHASSLLRGMRNALDPDDLNARYRPTLEDLRTIQSTLKDIRSGVASLASD
ncbi:MAG: hypothetical protein HY791_13640 [Deltaproteobacteria bacterium]|nr:hypothetical protein [Deltaproteobacteria bacterium]